MTTNSDELKRRAAEKAVTFVESGMVVGLGTGSTAVHAVRAIGRRLQDGRLHDILGIPTSKVTADEAEKVGIPLTTLNERPTVDLTIDGADEITPALDLIKGLGGALLREKIVAAASTQFVIVADDSKRTPQLGRRAPVPVEIIPFAQRPAAIFLESLGARVVLRQWAGQPYITDEKNFILDCFFAAGITDPTGLASIIRGRPGVVEHGLFLGLATRVIFAGLGGIEIVERS